MLFVKNLDFVPVVPKELISDLWFHIIVKYSLCLEYSIFQNEIEFIPTGFFQSRIALQASGLPSQLTRDKLRQLLLVSPGLLLRKPTQQKEEDDYEKEKVQP